MSRPTGPVKKVTRGEVDICYYSAGEGPPLLLISGLGSAGAAWWPIIDSLDDYKVITVDNRECGGSTRCDQVDYTLVDMADDLSAVLDDLGIERLYVLGTSMGGMIAQEFALKYPERVIKLMLVCTNFGEGSIPADAELLADAFAPRPEGEDAIEYTMKRTTRLTGPGFGEKNPDLLRRHAEVRVATGASTSGQGRQARAIRSFRTWDRLPGLDIPTLVIHGEADPLIPFENGQRIASRIPGAQLIALVGVGHYIPMEAPGELTSTIKNFFPVSAEVGA